MCESASQSSPVASGERILIIFCLGTPQGGFSCPFGAIHLLYLAENPSQTASVRVGRFSSQGVRAAGCKNWRKSPKGFFDKLKSPKGFGLIHT